MVICFRLFQKELDLNDDLLHPHLQIEDVIKNKSLLLGSSFATDSHKYLRRAE